MTSEQKVAAAALECAALDFGEAAHNLVAQISNRMDWLNAMGRETFCVSVNPLHCNFRKPAHWFRASQFPLIQFWVENVNTPERLEAARRQNEWLLESRGWRPRPWWRFWGSLWVDAEGHPVPPYWKRACDSDTRPKDGDAQQGSTRE